MTESTWRTPPVMRLVSLTAGVPAVALQGAGADPLLARIAGPARPIDVVAADGITRLNAFYLPPARTRRDPRGSPTLVEVYGGPGFRMVNWAWHRDRPLLAYWQQLGFGVLLIDNRGVPGRDRAFSHAHYRALGKIEVDDLFSAVRQLPALVPGIDPKRIGVIGYSYGGFLAARAVLDAASPFAAAMAGAPVVDWTRYDTAYTERYLGLPAGGQAPPYLDANLVSRAGQLSRPLMLLHGTADDNVLFENSLRLMLALQNEGKLFETVIYPGEAHGVGGRKLQLHVDRATTDFFVRRLQP